MHNIPKLPPDDLLVDFNTIWDAKKKTKTKASRLAQKNKNKSQRPKSSVKLPNFTVTIENGNIFATRPHLAVFVFFLTTQE